MVLSEVRSAWRQKISMGVLRKQNRSKARKDRLCQVGKEYLYFRTPLSRLLNTDILLNHPSSFKLENRHEETYLRSIWQTLQDVTRVKVCILKSWQLESA